MLQEDDAGDSIVRDAEVSLVPFYTVVLGTSLLYPRLVVLCDIR
jgi:hypothetical protein